MGPHMPGTNKNCYRSLSTPITKKIYDSFIIESEKWMPPPKKKKKIPIFTQMKYPRRTNVKKKAPLKIGTLVIVAAKNQTAKV